MSESDLPPLDPGEIVRCAGQLPAASGIVFELLRVIDQDEVGAATLAEIVSRDPAIVIRLLRIANSSFYALPRQVESVADAIAILGWRQVRTLAAGIAVFHTFGDVRSTELELGRFWRHGVSVAVAARELALRMRLNEGGTFVAGLIHDIGRLVVAHAFPEYARAIARYQGTHACPVVEAEQAVLGLDHAHIGGLLAERWRFPPAICEGIAQHHAAVAAPLPPLATAVRLANALAPCHTDFPHAEAMHECVARLDWATAGLTSHDGLRALAAVEREAGFLSGMLIGE